MENITPKYNSIPATDEIVVEPISDLGVTNIVTPQILQQNYIKSANYVTGVSGWQIDADGNVEFNEGDFRGTVEVGSLHIPDEDTTDDSFHVETDGDTFWGCTQSDFTSDHDNAKAFILKTGQVKFQNVSVGGEVTQYKLNDDGIFSYGDGSDGALSTTGNVTLTSDKYYTNLTINTGHTFNPNGWRIFCNGTLTLVGTGKISRNGNNGTAGTNGSGQVAGTGGAGASALSDGYLKGSVAGVAGSNGVNGSSGGGAWQCPSAPSNGTAGTATSNSIGSNGVAGGNGGNGGGSSASGGIAGVATASNVKLIANWHLATLLDIGSTGASVKFDNSAGSGAGAGGGGGCNAVNGIGGGGGGGGGSASSGGIIAIYAKNIIIGASALIEANGGAGGNGGNGGNASGSNNANGGGGGGTGAGGNGGQIILVYNEITNDGSITVTAGLAGQTVGTGGTGNGLGASGSDGSLGANGTIGTIRLFNLSL